MTEFINWAVNYLLFPLELLIACVLYMLPLEKRRNFPLRVILGILACLALAAFIPRSLLRYLLEFALTALFAWACCSLSVWDALFCAVCAYATQHFAYSAHAFLYQLLGRPGGWYYWLKLIIYAAVYLLFCFAFARRLPEERIVTVVNASDKSVPLILPWTAPVVWDLLTGRKLHPRDGTLFLALPPYGGSLLI